MNLPRQSFISFTVQPGTHSNNNRNGAAHHTDSSTARLKSRLSVEINFIMCVGRGDETEYKLPGFKHADGPGCGAPGCPVLGALPLSQLPNRKAFRVGREPWNYLWKQIAEVEQRVDVSAGQSPNPHIQPPLVVFLTLFFFPSRICSSRGQSL